MLAGVAGAVAMVPAAAFTGGLVSTGAAADDRRAPQPVAQPIVGPAVLSVDGSLPTPPDVEDLATVELPPSTGPLGIPATALKAYRNAARVVSAEMPGCNVDWALLASIGRIESNHALGGYLDAKGNTLEPILGPVLNGVGPVAAIADTDGGRLDGHTRWDRAVGPTQFIPPTWQRYAADGNGDGVSDPSNIYDATVASARYLCSGGMDLSKPDQLRAAVYRYNNSDAYVDTVLRWAEAYRRGVSSVPDSDVPLAVPRGDRIEAPSPVNVSASGQGRPPGRPGAPGTSQPPTSGSGSTTPTTPTSPSDPTSPTDPSPDPDDPTDPSEPTDPPTDPSEPTDPPDCDDETTPDEPTPPESGTGDDGTGESGTGENGTGEDGSETTTPPTCDPEDGTGTDPSPEPTEPTESASGA